MVLSEREQQILERIANGLCADDPRLAGRLANGASITKDRRRRRIGAAVIFTAGLAMMTGAVLVPREIAGGVLAVAVLGYLTMFGAALRWFTTPPVCFARWESPHDGRHPGQAR
jgi:hypothetical protein